MVQRACSEGAELVACLTEELLQAVQALRQVLVAQRAGEAQVATGAECLAGNYSDPQPFEDELSQFCGGLWAYAFNFLCRAVRVRPGRRRTPGGYGGSVRLQ